MLRGAEQRTKLFWAPRYLFFVMEQCGKSCPVCRREVRQFGYHAPWAGLVDGNYAQTFQPDAAPVPDFALLKIHPWKPMSGTTLPAWETSTGNLPCR